MTNRLATEQCEFTHKAEWWTLFFLRLSLSDPDLSSKFVGQTSFLWDTADMMPKRKDSVSKISKRPSIPNNGSRRRRSSASVSSHHPSLPEYRRNSLCGAIWPCKRLSSSVSPEIPQSPEDINLTTWSSLLSCIPDEERRNSCISRHHVFISIPVCKIGKEKPLLFTSFEAIEHTLRRFYPELVVKKRLSSSPDTDVDEIKEEDVDTVPPFKFEKNNDPQKLSVELSHSSRRTSINTCISNMRRDTQDYDKQLVGVKNVGTFADEETLKVLFAKSDAISCVIEAMKTFPEKEELQINACNSLLKMASASEANCVHILANDGLDAISSTLRRHQDNTDITRLLIATIAFISTGMEPAASLVNGGLHHQILGVMSRHCTDRLIVRECCFILGNLIASVETAQQLMYVGSVHTIISLVKQFPKDPIILENVCRTLGSFAIYDETCLDVARAGAISTVLEAMESPANASIIECGCWALACLTACDQTCDEMVKLGGIDMILKLMVDYPQEQSLQDYAIRILCNLSDYDHTLPSVSTEEVITVLQRVLNQSHDCIELLEIITTTLCHIIGGDEKLSNFAVEQKCIKAIVNVMLENTDNSDIQENGCKIIGNVAVQDYPRKMAEMDGASKAVISALLNNENNAAIQEVGCLALMNLTAENKDNKVRIKNAGAVPTLLGTLREYSYDSNIVLCALKALGNLISLEEVCHLLLDEKGLETIVSLSRAYATDEKILVLVTMVLCGITELPDLKEEEVKLINKTLVEILSSNQNDADVTLYVCEATENLLQTDVGREILMESNRLGLIQSAINSFPNNPEIHGTCCKVIAVVAFYMDSRKRLITETTVKSVLKSMELFPQEVELQIVGCGTISCILEKIAILKHEVIGQGGIGIIQNAVNHHPEESRLGVVALMALGFILPFDVNTYPEESRTVYNAIIQCMKNFGENKEIQIAGCNALSRLQLSDKKDVISMTAVIMNSLRRHGEEPEVQKNAALALRPSYQQDDFINIIGQVLKSPTLKVNEHFWNEFEKNKGAK